MVSLRRMAQVMRLVLSLVLLVSCMTAFGQTFKTLHSFTGGADGAFPLGALIQGQDGNLYGTNNDNTVFKIAPDGSGFTAYSLLSVYGCGGPWSGVTQGADGTLYGASVFGGITGYGGVWSIRPDGTGLTLLHSFTAGDGLFP